MCTQGSRGYFFLIDTDGSRRSAEEKELLISTGLFHLRYFKDGPLEPGCKICSLQKKEKTLKWSPQKRSRPALTYHELLSNFVFQLDLDNSARICSACRIALTSSQYKQSAERLLMEVNTFNFLCFEMGKEHTY